MDLNAISVTRKTLSSLLILTVCVFLSSQAIANDINKWGQWINNYYMHKEAHSTPNFLKAFDESGLLADKKSIKAPIAGSLSQILLQNQDKISTWLDPKFSSDMKETIAAAIILAELENKTPPSYVEKVKEISESFNLKPIIFIEPTTPSDLDMMWGAFFASANPVFINKIIGTLNKSHSPTGDKMRDTILRGAASWSLVSNMRQHALVESIVKKEQENAPKSLKPALDEIWSKFKKEVRK